MAGYASFLTTHVWYGGWPTPYLGTLVFVKHSQSLSVAYTAITLSGPLVSFWERTHNLSNLAV